MLTGAALYGVPKNGAELYLDAPKATIVGLIKAPNLYSPLRHVTASIKSRNCRPLSASATTCEAGYDPLFVQQQLGHSYASTTSLYTSVGSDFKQRVVQQIIARRLRMEEADG